MVQLNLPAYNANIKRMDGMLRIFDSQRRKFVALTPEEWVRQNFVHFLLEHKHYSAALLANEVSLTLNGMTRRCDSVLYGTDMKPRMIIEYKRPDVEITQRVFNQICRYNMVLQVEYLIVSNGLQHYCCKIDYERKGYTFLEDIPDYKEIAGN